MFQKQQAPKKARRGRKGKLVEEVPRYKSPFEAAKRKATLKRQNTEEKKVSDDDDDDVAGENDRMEHQQHQQRHFLHRDHLSSETHSEMKQVPYSIISSQGDSIPAMVELSDNPHRHRHPHYHTVSSSLSAATADDSFERVSHHRMKMGDRSVGMLHLDADDQRLFYTSDNDEMMADLTQARHSDSRRHRSDRFNLGDHGSSSVASSSSGIRQSSADESTREGLRTALSLGELSIYKSDFSQRSTSANRGRSQTTRHHSDHHHHHPSLTYSHSRSRSRRTDTETISYEGSSSSSSSSSSAVPIPVTAVGHSSSYLSHGISQQSNVVGCLSRADHVLSHSDDASGGSASGSLDFCVGSQPSWFKRSDSSMSISQSGYLTPSSQSAHFLNDDEMRAQLNEDRRIANVNAAQARFQCHPRMHHSESPPTSSFRRLDCSGPVLSSADAGGEGAAGSSSSSLSSSHLFGRNAECESHWPSDMKSDRSSVNGNTPGGSSSSSSSLSSSLSSSSMIPSCAGRAGSSSSSSIAPESLIYDDCSQNEFCLDHRSAEDCNGGWPSSQSATTMTSMMCKDSSMKVLNNNHNNNHHHLPSSMISDRRVKRSKRKRRSTISHGTGRIAREYEFICELGEGSFGKVGRYRRRSDGVEYAIKRVSSARYGSITEATIQEVKREGMVLSGLQTHGTCEHIVRYFDMWFDSYLCDIYKVFDFYLVCEYCSLGSLDPRRPLFHSEYTLATILLHISRALKFIHGAGVVHLDVKPENILISRVSGRSSGNGMDYGDLNSSSGSSSSDHSGGSSSSSLSANGDGGSVMNNPPPLFREVFKLADFGLALKLKQPCQVGIPAMASSTASPTSSIGGGRGAAAAARIGAMESDEIAGCPQSSSSLGKVCSGASGYLSLTDDENDDGDNPSIEMDTSMMKAGSKSTTMRKSGMDVRSSSSSSSTSSSFGRSRTLPRSAEPSRGAGIGGERAERGPPSTPASSSSMSNMEMNSTMKNVTFQIDEGDKRYLSLELLEGRVSRNDQSLYQCDMFALGATVYEMMIGKELPGEGLEYHDLRRGIFDSVPEKYELAKKDSLAYKVIRMVEALMKSEPSLRPMASSIVDQFTYLEHRLLREKHAELVKCNQELIQCKFKLRQLKQQQQFFDAKARSTSPTHSFGW